MSKDTGGPAFPQNGSVEIGDMSYNGSTGMTLRDYFAAKAMVGLLGGEHEGEDEDAIGDVANAAYRTADAMLAERDK